MLQEIVLKHWSLDAAVKELFARVVDLAVELLLAQQCGPVFLQEKIHCLKINWCM